MSQEELLARIEKALEILLLEVLGDPLAPDSVQIGAGKALNVLRGVDE